MHLHRWLAYLLLHRLAVACLRGGFRLVLLLLLLLLLGLRVHLLVLLHVLFGRVGVLLGRLLGGLLGRGRGVPCGAVESGGSAGGAHLSGLRGLSEAGRVEVLATRV